MSKIKNKSIDNNLKSNICIALPDPINIYFFARYKNHLAFNIILSFVTFTLDEMKMIHSVAFYRAMHLKHA